MEHPIKVYIVDDHEIFRNGLKMVFARNNEMEITGEAESGEEFLARLNSIEFDVVLMDIKMKGINGIETTKEALVQKPDLKVLALSTFGEEEYLHEMINAGAKGFLLKNVDKETLFGAIKTINQGQNYFSPELLPFFTNKFLDNKNQIGESALTKHELEVLQLIAEDFTNDEIAETLLISKRTVDTHKNNLISKTGSKNIVGLLVYTIKNKTIFIDS